VFALAVATVLPDDHTAEAVAVVPSGGKTGLSPGEASNLATTYATLIPEDKAILESAAKKLRLHPARVRDSLQVTHDFDTSILRVLFSDPDPLIALQGSRAVAESIEGPRPVSKRIEPGSISVVALPSTTSTHSLDPAQAALLGLILGLLGGTVFMLAWDRADVRIRDSKLLSAEAGCPASSFRDASDESIVALLDRWTDIAGTTPLRVALLAATPSAEDECVRAAQRFVKVGPRAQRRVTRIGDPDAHVDPHILLDIGGAVGGLAAGERLARTADLIVVLVVDGTSTDDLRHALDVLEQFGSRPDWALFIDRSVREIGSVGPAEAPALAPVATTTRLRQDRWTPVGNVSRVDNPARRAGAE
jgi:hypothetical protein